MQRIDFYFDEYRPKPLSFDSRFAAFICALCLLGLLLIGWIGSNQVEDLRQRHKSRQVQADKMQQQLLNVQEKLAKKAKAKDLQSEINSAQQELNSYRKVLSTVNLPSSQFSVNFSQVLTDLSKRKAEAVWLTKIDLAGQNLSLSGVATKTDAVPRYVDELKEADSLRRLFDELKVERDENNRNVINFQLLNGRLTHED